MVRCLGYLILLLSLSRAAIADTILVTAGPAPSTVIGGGVTGTLIAPDQWLGVRFAVSMPTLVEEFGAWVRGTPFNSTTEVFAGILPLDSRNALPPGGGPQSDPSNSNSGPTEYGVIEADFLGHTTFDVPIDQTSEIVTPLVTTLQPGTYALVIGSGLFGVSGRAAAPSSIPALPGSWEPMSAGFPLVILPSGELVFGDWSWRARSVNQPTSHRFFLNGRQVPEPSTVTLLLACFCGAVRRNRVA